MVTMARTSTCSTTEGFSRPVLNDSPRIEQIVGRERRERVSQLTWCGGGCFDSRRRVNSIVRAHRCVRTASGSDPIKAQLEWMIPSLPLRVLTRRTPRGDSPRKCGLVFLQLFAIVSAALTRLFVLTTNQ